MNLTLAVSLLFLGGCHFCADELVVIGNLAPFLGLVIGKLHTYLHRKKCPHNKEIKNSEVYDNVVEGDKKK